ncbi:hypothetical protein [Acrocarpospora sp. B8E8]|uniref:hypothetical protein n=1 Tax=Acrocarpospora sp. B8E8 TaxID=3153572 RepID=UPI00325DACF1
MSENTSAGLIDINGLDLGFLKTAESPALRRVYEKAAQDPDHPSVAGFQSAL